MRPPIASLVVLLLVVAALTMIGIDGVRAAPIPQAVLNGEQQIAADTAQSLRTAIDAEASTVRRAAGASAATSTSTPATTLKALTSARKTVLGDALLDRHTGKLVAAGGKTVPLAGVNARTASGHGAIPPRLVTSGGTPQLLYLSRLTLPAQQEDPDQDHCGMYMGLDDQGRHRFYSSRSAANGPTMGDMSGHSLLDGADFYARGFRAARRL
ncbi:hypothetical protein [Streptomyces sp. NPDC050564]|uniref:hypothetical protein n=1 Tax=Streptomyces sp. NPDC050564 TaxID=3365631 RepID=UPI0037BDEA22